MGRQAMAIKKKKTHKKKKNNNEQTKTKHSKKTKVGPNRSLVVDRQADRGGAAGQGILAENGARVAHVGGVHATGPGRGDAEKDGHRRCPSLDVEYRALKGGGEGRDLKLKQPALRLGQRSGKQSGATDEIIRSEPPPQFPSAMILPIRPMVRTSMMAWSMRSYAASIASWIIASVSMPIADSLCDCRRERWWQWLQW